jgi:hypothetical protein
LQNLIISGQQPEQVQHLILSTNKTALAYRLPLILVQWIGGKANTKALSFEALQHNYIHKLEAGAKASKPFIQKMQPFNAVKKNCWKYGNAIPKNI